MWPRSFLRGQPYEWVVLLDGTIIGNRSGLCGLHHDACSSPIGGHKARIKFEGGIFYWEEKKHVYRDAGTGEWPKFEDSGEVVWTRVGLLEPQPPGALTEMAPSAVHPTAKQAAPEEVCPTCGHHKVKKKKEVAPGPPRKTKEWTLVVPDDAEIGSDVLDEWADLFATMLGFDDASSRLRRYHSVATVFAWVMQHQDEFIADLAEAANASH
jgi:hypothetical protein